MPDDCHFERLAAIYMAGKVTIRLDLKVCSFDFYAGSREFHTYVESVITKMLTITAQEVH